MLFSRKRASILLLSACTTLLAQTPDAKTPPPALPDDDIAAVTHSLAERLVKVYPFPEISAQWAAMLKSKTDAGAYHGLPACGLDRRLTADLQAVHKDVHLRVNCVKPSTDHGAAQFHSDSNDYGFEGVQLYPKKGIAYIASQKDWPNRPEVYENAAAAMQLASHSNYVIIDLRDNGGGAGMVGRFLASYFYRPGDEQYYLYGFGKDRAQDQQEWTYAYVPGPHIPDAKLYILVNHHTASATEGFAYAMQKLKRATIVGQTTIGAGIAGGFVPLGGGSERAFIPTKMIVGPHTQVGWEGEGVTPDVPTDPGQEITKTMELIDADIATAKKPDTSNDKAPAPPAKTP